MPFSSLPQMFFERARELAKRPRCRVRRGRLQAAKNVGGGRVTHAIAIGSKGEIDGEVLRWLKTAYDAAMAKLHATEAAQRVIDRAVQLFGGEGVHGAYADTWIYDPATRSWRQARPSLSPSPRIGHGLVARGRQDQRPGQISCVDHGDERAARAVQVRERLLHGMPGAELLRLQGPLQVGLVGERCADLIAAGATVIDVRRPYEYEAGRIAGARNLEMNELSAAAQTIARDRPLILYCRSGDRSRMAAEAFRGAGYDAHNLADGIAGWVEAGRALEPEGGFVRAPLPAS